jgi:hypothetical protein
MNNGSDSSSDDDWLMSPLGPVVALALDQHPMQQMTMPLSAAIKFQIKRRRLLTSKRRGSRPGRSGNILRHFEEFYERFMNYYFVDRPRFNDRVFRQRFRCRKTLFLWAVEQITAHDDYFKQKPDATGRLGMRPLHKVCVAWRKLCYGYGNDSMDECYEVAASTNRKILEHFCDATIALWEKAFIRRPNAADIERIGTVIEPPLIRLPMLIAHTAMLQEKRGFRGALLSIDCTHWPWDKCPKSFQGQFKNGRKDYCSVVMEAGCSPDRRIWHLFCTIPGTCNDINILDSSPLFNEIIKGTSPPFKYVLNGRSYTSFYYIVDGIYPAWRVFARPLSQPLNQAQRHYTQEHESDRKDIESAFGILKKKFLIIKHPAEFWSLRTMHKVMKTVVIWHNMILEDEYDDASLAEDEDFDHNSIGHVRQFTAEERDAMDRESFGVIQGLGRRLRGIQDETGHFQLRDDLIQHLWDHKSQCNL